MILVKQLQKVYIVQSFNQHNNLFQETCNNLLETRLTALHGLTQRLNENKFSDNIDKIINQKNFANQFKSCSQCNLKSPSTNRICKSCKGKLIKPKIADGESATKKKPVNPYSLFKNKLLPNDVSMIVGEPKMQNPNSFGNLAIIVKSLGRRANIEQYSNDDNAQKRKRLIIENDGGILSPVFKVDI